jgi:hypothetical protein
MDERKTLEARARISCFFSRLSGQGLLHAVSIVAQYVKSVSISNEPDFSMYLFIIL